jgi:hypothetical protein
LPLENGGDGLDDDDALHQFDSIRGEYTHNGLPLYREPGVDPLDLDELIGPREAARVATAESRRRAATLQWLKVNVGTENPVLAKSPRKPYTPRRQAPSAHIALGF